MISTVEELNKALTVQSEELSLAKREQDTVRKRLAETESKLADTEARRRSAVLARHIEREAFQSGVDRRQVPLVVSYLTHPKPGEDRFDVDEDDSIVHRTAAGVRSSLTLGSWFAEQKRSNAGLFSPDAPKAQTSVDVQSLSPAQKMALGRKQLQRH